MFRASLCPSSGEQDVCYCMWCAALVLLDVVGSGCGALRCGVRALWRLLFEQPSQCSHPRTQRPTTATNHMQQKQHNTCSNIRLVLLKMGIMMPETCWEFVKNKHLTVASCWFSLWLHNLLTMHGHRNLKLIQDIRCPDRELNPARHTLSMEPIPTVFGVSAYRRWDWFIPDSCSQFG